MLLCLASCHKSLPYPLGISDIEKGEAPHILLIFLKVLYTGSTSKESPDQRTHLVISVSDDIVYAVTKGQVKPSKHCLLGLGITSIAGSRKVIDLLNTFGHSLNYNMVEELETDVASTICDKQVMPDGIALQAGLAPGLAFINYNENTAMLSGANTLHDTGGITYQNVLRTEVSDELRTEDVSDDQDVPDPQLKAKRTGRKCSFGPLSQMNFSHTDKS